MLRFLTAGESHGPGLVTIVEGLPSGLEVSVDGLAEELARRRLGHGRGRRMTLEKDELEIMGGVRFGRTLGSPVAVIIRNTEWPKWQGEMATGPGESKRPLRTPRPGHADLAGMIKYDTRDARDILERASARETAARTVVGYLAKQLLATVGIEIVSHVVAIGDVAVARDAAHPRPGDLQAVDSSPVRAFDGAGERAMIAAIDGAKEDRNTLGGVFEVPDEALDFVRRHRLASGLGRASHAARRLSPPLNAHQIKIILHVLQPRSLGGDDREHRFAHHGRAMDPRRRLVDEGFELAGDAHDIDGRGEDHAVGSLDAFEDGRSIVDLVADAGLADAALAADAIGDLGAGQAQHGRIDTVRRQQLGDLVQQGLGLAVLARRAIEGDNFFHSLDFSVDRYRVRARAARPHHHTEPSNTASRKACSRRGSHGRTQESWATRIVIEPYVQSLIERWLATLASRSNTNSSIVP